MMVAGNATVSEYMGRSKGQTGNVGEQPFHQSSRDKNPPRCPNQIRSDQPCDVPASSSSHSHVTDWREQRKRNSSAAALERVSAVTNLTLVLANFLLLGKGCHRHAETTQPPVGERKES